MYSFPLDAYAWRPEKLRVQEIAAKLQERLPEGCTVRASINSDNVEMIVVERPAQSTVESALYMALSAIE